jgi:hypothetical protein
MAGKSKMWHSISPKQQEGERHGSGTINLAKNQRILVLGREAG